MSNRLPTGWSETTVGDVCLPVSQRGPSSDKATFRYVDLGAMDNKKRRIADPSTVQTSEAPSRAKQIVRDGDVVFSTVRVYLENIGLVPPELDGEVASTAFCVLRPASGVDPRYLYYYVTSRPFIISVNKLQRGNSPPSVQDGDVRRQALAVAPTEEQGRIVSKIDELFSRIDEGERALERVQMLVERYRQSVLKAAVTGELTREWREKNKDKLESGEALLARILKARREAWEKAELGKMKAKGITPTDDKWKQKYEEPVSPDTTDLPELPNGWAWASTEQICASVRDGTHDTPKYVDDGIPLITSKNLLPGGLDFDNVQLISAEDHAAISKRSGVESGDILFAMIGTIGNPVVVRVVREFSIKNVGLFKRNESAHIPDYLRLWLSSPLFNSWLEPRKKGTSQKFAPLGLLRAIPVPLPCLSEQRRIVDEAERLLLSGGRAAKDVASQCFQSVALRQVVLRAAFGGHLVSQDPTDEPASALLERIAAERGTDNAAPKHGRKKKTAA